MSIDGEKKKSDQTMQSVPMQANAVSIKQIPFWIQEPEMWFLQIEAQFALVGISQDTTKYYHVLASFNEKAMLEMKDVLLRPPSQDKYEYLKKETIKRFAVPQEKKLIAFLEDEQIGDRTPSQFLRHLKSLGGSAATDELVKIVWTRRLPNHLQALVAAQIDRPVEKIAEIADRVEDALPQRNIAGINSTQDFPTSRINLQTQLTKLSENMEKVTEELAEIKQNRFQRHVRPQREEWRSCGRQRSNSRDRASENSTCWYHQRFGKNSTKCRLPCNWNSKNGNCGQ